MASVGKGLGPLDSFDLVGLHTQSQIVLVVRGDGGAGLGSQQRLQIDILEAKRGGEIHLRGKAPGPVADRKQRPTLYDPYGRKLG